MTTEFSPFAPPTLGDAPVGTAPPPPPISPTLPAPAAAPAVPPTPPDAPPVPSPSSTPPESTPSRRPLIILLLLGVATIAGAAWFAVASSNDATDSTPPPAAPPESSGLDIEPQEVSSPVVEPIDDAREVVVDIDDNGEEAEALDLLDLDDTGNPVVDSEPVAGHSFTWTYGVDATATVTVDNTTGDYDFASSDGTERRRVDGRSYRRGDQTGWTEADSSAGGVIERFGFDGPITVDQVIDDVTARYATITSEPADGTTNMTGEVDAATYRADRPGEFITWMSLLGQPATKATPEVGDTASIELEIGADGRTVEQLTFTTAAFTTTYTLDEVFETAPAIEAPEL